MRYQILIEDRYEMQKEEIGLPLATCKIKKPIRYFGFIQNEKKENDLGSYIFAKSNNFQSLLFTILSSI